MGEFNNLNRSGLAMLASMPSPYIVPARPPEPSRGGPQVWYRGWEVGYDADADFWGGEGWRAYKGGCDLDAPEVMAATYAGCLDEIDEQEDER